MNPSLLYANGEDPWTVIMLFGRPICTEVVNPLFEIARNIFQEAGLNANVLAVHTNKGFGKYAHVSDRVISRFRSREDIIGFSTGYVPPPETDFAKFGVIGAGTPKRGFLVYGRESVLPPVARTATSIAKQVQQCYAITYGYQYVIDRYYGPEHHALGMLLTRPLGKRLADLPEIEVERAARWFNNYERVMPAGYLRDVFPTNFLSEIHKKMEVEGTPLFEWITEGHSRGMLQEISPTLWAWHVPQTKCTDIADQLESLGLLASE
jgi:hypothetical protein